MSLIINGMSLPSECSECLFSCYDVSVGAPAECIILGERSARYSRLKKCPLTEIPTPHGRLIDADAYQYSGDLIDEPTIIEAEQESEARKWARVGRDISKGLQEGIESIKSEVPE